MIVNNESTGFQYGENTFEVLDVTEEISKNNIKYFNMKIKLTDCNGKEKTSYDNLFKTTKAEWKIKVFCKSVGKDALLKDINSIKSLDIVSSKGSCISELQKWPAIKRYLFNDKKETDRPSVEEIKEKDIDDELPF